jgi:hypothetical protein
METQVIGPLSLNTYRLNPYRTFSGFVPTLTPNAPQSLTRSPSPFALWRAQPALKKPHLGVNALSARFGLTTLVNTK